MLDSIKNRRSIFPAQFIEDEISKTEITALLEAANCAPNHFKSEPWRFKVLHSRGSKEALGEFLSATYKKKVDKFSDAKYQKLQGLPLKSAVVIAICMQRDTKERMPEWEEIAAVSMAVQNLWLQATEMKMGGYWSSPELIIKEMHHFFQLDNKETCLGFFYLGKHNTPLLQRKRGDIKEKITWL